VETVKGYVTHERGTLETVVRARQHAISATGGVEERAKAENALTQSLRSLLAVAEAYPELKANQNFLALQEELASTENKIGFSRQFYNDSAMQYKNRVEVFPATSSPICLALNRSLSSNWRWREREAVQVKF